MNLCEHTDYPCYSKKKVWLCSMCDLPRPEPEYSLGYRRIRTIHPEHAEAVGVDMSYYNRYWDGNRTRETERLLAENDNVFEVGMI
jgi:hypothetical protein